MLWPWLRKCHKARELLRKHLYYCVIFDYTGVTMSPTYTIWPKVGGHLTITLKGFPLDFVVRLCRFVHSAMGALVRSMI